MTPHFTTLAEAVAEIGNAYPDNGFTFQDQQGHEVTYTFPKLEQETGRRAAALQALGLSKADRIGLVIIEPEQFVLTFLAAIRVGIVPVPIYPPPFLGKIESYLQQTGAILRSSGSRFLITSSRLVHSLTSLVPRVDKLEQVIGVEELRSSGQAAVYSTLNPTDVVFLQYTSGSTMDPRGVMVTNNSLLSNVRGFICDGLEMDPSCDKGVTWLPLYHDMGLIGFVLGPITYGISVVFIPTMRFVKNANVWMEAIHNHRGTISFAPNFAFALAMRRAREAELLRWNLSSLRALGCGAEPIQAETMLEFSRLFGTHCGLPSTAIMPAYGLAEATLAVTMKPLRENIRIRTVDKATFEETGISKTPSNGTPHQTHVSCGVPFPGHTLAIMSPEHQPLAECIQGEVWVKGPSLGAGYFNNDPAWQAQRQGEWLRTGDLGYIAAGQLYVTGRIKDLIILNGRNLHPQEIEWIASRVEGVRPNCAVAFSCPFRSGEGLVIALEARARDQADVVEKVAEAVFGATFVKPVDIVCLAPGSLPKTSSGKLKRQLVRSQYLSKLHAAEEEACRKVTTSPELF